MGQTERETQQGLKAVDATNKTGTVTQIRVAKGKIAEPLGVSRLLTTGNARVALLQTALCTYAPQNYVLVVQDDAEDGAFRRPCASESNHWTHS
jgi:hypothetical protein